MNRFLLKLKKRIQGPRYAEFASIFQWSGLEIVDFRDYVAGDPARYINRKMSAKNDALFVDIFQQDRDLTLTLLLDINANRCAGESQSNATLVSEYLSDILLYAHKHQIKVVVVTPGKVFDLGHDMARSFGFLEKFPELLPRERVYQGHLPELLSYAKKIRKRWALVLISDLLAIDEKSAHTIKSLQAKHAVYAFQLPVDTLEGENYVGRMVEKKPLPGIGVRVHRMGK